MELPPNFHKKHRRIGLIALLFVVLHAVFSAYVSLAPQRMIPQNKITDVYRHLVALGPFFTESRITYSHFMAVRFKQRDAWSPTQEFSKIYFSNYNRYPWRLDNLAYVSYEKQLVYEVAAIADGKSFNAIKNSDAFRELNSYLMHELLPQTIDSVKLICGFDYYDPTSRSYRPDTLFVYTYDPNGIANAKE